MLKAKILTACADLTDQLSGCFCDGYDLSYAQCKGGTFTADCNIAIIGSDQFQSVGKADAANTGADKSDVENAIQYYAHLGIPVFLAWTDSKDDFRELALKLGCTDYLAPPFIESVVNSKCKTYSGLANLRKNLFVEPTGAVERSSGIGEGEVNLNDLHTVQDAAILCLATIARVRDHSTGNHILRTQHYVKALAEHLRRSPEYCDELDDETIELGYNTSALHDIGQVGIPDHILKNPGELSPEEYEIMKSHARLGYEAMHSAQQLIEHQSSSRTIRFLAIAQQVTLSHHERWDGEGYPEGLKGKSIPLVARLMAVADVYDAMISRRPYKNAMDHAYVKNVIAKGSGSHFDPSVVNAFLDLEDMFERISHALEDAFPSSAEMTLHSISDLMGADDSVSSPS
jgi:putative two-component system response regulator